MSAERFSHNSDPASPTSSPSESLFLPKRKILDTTTDGSSRALTTIVNTSKLIDAYIYHHPENPTPIFTYLKEETIPLLSESLTSLPVLLPMIPIKSESDRNVLKKIMKSEGPKDIDKGRENLDVIATIFNAMPDVQNHLWLKDGFSRKGILCPPSTISGWYHRITEIAEVVTNIANDSYEKQRIVHYNTARARTGLFLDTAQKLTIKAPRSEKEAKADERDSFNKLLDSVHATPVSKDMQKKIKEKELFNRQLSWLTLPDDF